MPSDPTTRPSDAEWFIPISTDRARQVAQHVIDHPEDVTAAAIEVLGRPDPEIPCITRDPREPAGPQYLAVCTGDADLIATSTYCPPGECGGHPICRPCYELARREGLVR